MKKIASLFIAVSLLVGCGGNDNKDDNKKASFKITEDSYVVQMIAADYGSSQVAVGNILGDRTATQSLLTQAKSDYSISTYENYLYQIGKKGIDSINKFDTNLGFNDWNYSTNYKEPGSANTYKLLQQTETNGYLINYGSTKVLQVNPSAKSEMDFVKAEIDLSAYTFTGADYPRMSDAVIVNNHLFVAMQRLGADWSYNQPYIAVIDIETNIEVDTNPQQDGLKGIPLNAKNTSTIVEYNGFIYAAGRGDYNSDTGGLERIDADSYAVTTLIDESSFPELNSAEDNIYYHVRDVVVVRNNLAYATLSIEAGWPNPNTSKIATINPTTGALNLLDTVTELDGKEISDINIDANDRLWIGIANADNPGIYVLDTDTNTLSGEFIELDMPVGQIEFLTVQ